MHRSIYMKGSVRWLVEWLVGQFDDGARWKNCSFINSFILFVHSLIYSTIRERACFCVNATHNKCRHRHRYVIIFVVLPLSSTPSVPSLSSSSSTSSSSSLLSLSFYGQVGHDHVSYSFEFLCLQVGWLVCLLTGFLGWSVCIFFADNVHPERSLFSKWGSKAVFIWHWER